MDEFLKLGRLSRKNLDVCCPLSRVCVVQSRQPLAEDGVKCLF